jgi:hypothetical protein
MSCPNDGKCDCHLARQQGPSITKEQMAEALREWADRHDPDGPLHTQALGALEKLRSLTAQMPLRMADGRNPTVADTLSQLFIAAQATIEHHRRFTDYERRSQP